MKSLNKFMTGLLMALLLAPIVGAAFDLTMGQAFGLNVVASTAISLTPVNAEAGVAHAAVLKEMWEAELLKKLRFEHAWMSSIPSKDQYVGNNAIHLHEIGVDPIVLVNNTTYPIAVTARVDSDNVVALNKYDTTNTSISKDELYALPYDKTGSVITQHRETLEQVTSTHGLHIIAPAADGSFTPVLETTGADDGSGRKRITVTDIINHKKQWNLIGVKSGQVVLVLCPEHVADLLIADVSLQKQYHNHVGGFIAANYYGFKIYEDIYNPVYTAANAKKAFDAAAAGGDRNASTSFWAGDMVRAKGTADMFYRLAELDPENRRNVVGFQMYNIAMPKRAKYRGAIISGTV